MGNVVLNPEIQDSIDLFKKEIGKIRKSSSDKNPNNNQDGIKTSPNKTRNRYFDLITKVKTSLTSEKTLINNSTLNKRLSAQSNISNTHSSSRSVIIDSDVGENNLDVSYFSRHSGNPGSPKLNNKSMINFENQEERFHKMINDIKMINIESPDNQSHNIIGIKKKISNEDIRLSTSEIKSVCSSEYFDFDDDISTCESIRHKSYSTYISQEK